MLSQTFGQLHGRLVIGIGFWDSRRTKNCHRRPNSREHFERVHKFSHDPKDSPRILFCETKGAVVHTWRIANERQVTSIARKMYRCFLPRARLFARPMQETFLNPGVSSPPGA